MSTTPSYIAVEGPIGVGKTTLAQQLAEALDYATLLESGYDNPFLERFYRLGGSHALPCQLHFLLHRAEEMRQLRLGDLFSTGRVADFLMEKDRLFAELTLSAAELALYEEIYAQLTIDAPTPDLVVYLQAPARVLLHRVRERGIDAERRMGSDYLEQLAERYARFFHEYDTAPLLIVNATEVDFANEPEIFDELLKRIRQPSGPRTYFNPQPSLLA